MVCSSQKWRVGAVMQASLRRLGRLMCVRFERDAESGRVLFPRARRNQSEQREEEQCAPDDIDDPGATEFSARHSGLSLISCFVHFDREVSSSGDLILQRRRACYGAIDEDLCAGWL